MITLPVFADLKPPAPPAKPVKPPATGMHRRLVAAIRWDYEYALMSQADVVRKYRQVASAEQVRRVMDLEVMVHVKAQKHAMAWAKSSWRKIR